MRRSAVLPLLVAGLLAAGCDDGGGGADVEGLEDERAEVAAEGVAAGVGGAEAGAEGMTVRGEGRVTGEPDVLRVRVGVEHRDVDADAAIAAMEGDAADVIDALRDAGVAEEDVQTARLSIRPQARDAPDGQRVESYVATNIVEARVRDLHAVGAVIDAAIDAGGEATRVHGVAFQLEDNAELLQRARQEAVADARRRAEQYAEAAGVELGGLVSVEEVGAEAPEPLRHGAAEADAAGPPVAVGEEEVGVAVRVRWELVDGS